MHSKIKNSASGDNRCHFTLGHRLKQLRLELGLSQEAVGAQGFVSTPGWIKIEHGQRQASERLLDRLCRWLTEDKYLSLVRAKALREELLVLKYLGSRSPFVRALAQARALQLPDGRGRQLLAAEAPPRARRGRPPLESYGSRTAAGPLAGKGGR